MQKQDDLDYFLKELKGDDLDNKFLKRVHDAFKNKYEELIVHIFSNANTEGKLGWLVSETKMRVNKMTKKFDPKKFLTQSLKDEIPELMSHIFAVWTLKNSQHYNASRGIDENKAYLLMPHVGQVISIFRMFGIGYSKKSDKYDNLIQIGTGEGKSVVMAVAASIFALIGYDVNCSCYSEYLSSRDKQAFASVFEALGIEDHIEYGTFNKLCEKVLQMIFENKSYLSPIITKRGARSKVLLIDEVDVFLSEKYYGGLYLPSVYLNDSYIKNLLDEIWRNKNVSPLVLNTVKAMPAYTYCAMKFSN